MWLLRFAYRFTIEIISLGLAIVVAFGIYQVLAAIAAGVN